MCHDQTPSAAMTPQRPQQQGKLALLPVEILVQITGEPGKDTETLSAEDFKNLSSASISLFNAHRISYYLAEDCGFFRSAVRNANVEAMEFCARHGAAADFKWELPDGCQCSSGSIHTHHRPIDELLSCLAIGKVSIEKSLDALRWLLEREYDMTEQGDQDWYTYNEHCDHVPVLLIDILSKSPNRAHTEGICQMIKMLQSHGYSLPFHMDHSPWHCPFDDPVPLSVRKPMDVALRSHCPPYLLELVLKDYQRRLVDFKVWYDKCPPLMNRWAGNSIPLGTIPEEENGDGEEEEEEEEDIYLQLWYNSTSFLNVTWGLFCDLMGKSSSWVEEYPGEAADIFEKKVEILIEFEVLDAIEKKMLMRILRILRKRDVFLKAGRSVAGSDKDAYSLWRAFCGAVNQKEHKRLLGEAGEINLAYYDTEVNESVGAQVHSFSTWTGWNPNEVFYSWLLQNGTSRPKMPWGDKGVTQKPDGTWEDREWLRVKQCEDCMYDEEHPWSPHWYSFEKYCNHVGDWWTEIYVNQGRIPSQP